MKWWNKPVTFNILIKFMITFNIVSAIICWHLAYTGDLVNKEEQEYYRYLEERTELQSQVIKLYQEKYTQ